MGRYNLRSPSHRATAKIGNYLVLLMRPNVGHRFDVSPLPVTIKYLPMQ